MRSRILTWLAIRLREHATYLRTHCPSSETRAGVLEEIADAIEGVKRYL